MTEAKTQEQVATRVITIISTRGEKVKVPFAGSAWADLKKILEKGGTDADGKSFSRFDLNNMKCVESLNKSTLEHPEAVVPDGDFKLFLMPYKSKSGALTRTEAYAKIKSFMEAAPEAAKAHFNAEKNYTLKSNDTLNDLIESYKPGTKRAVSKEKAKAISDVVESVKEARTEDDLIEVLDGLSDNEKLDVIIKLLVGMKSKGISEAPKAVEAETLVTPVKSAEEIAKEEAEQKEKEEREAEEKRKEEERKAEEKRKKEEAEADEREMKELARGFGDVRL